MTVHVPLFLPKPCEVTQPCEIQQDSGSSTLANPRQGVVNVLLFNRHELN